jgi:hypothetical protein
MIFVVAASAFSRLSVSYVVRCHTPNMEKCPAFTSVSRLIPASLYKVQEDQNGAAGYSLTWQVPLTKLGCTCSTAAVSISASGTFVGVCPSSSGLGGRVNRRSGKQGTTANTTANGG